MGRPLVYRPTPRAARLTGTHAAVTRNMLSHLSPALVAIASRPCLTFALPAAPTAVKGNNSAADHETGKKERQHDPRPGHRRPYQKSSSWVG